MTLSASTLRTRPDNVNWYSLAQIATPVFNTPDIPFHHSPLQRDDQGRLTPLETIALPGTKFKCTFHSATVIQVELAEYPSSTPLYVDARCLQEVPLDTPEREIKLPDSATILRFLESCVGKRYFWGGNYVEGIPEMLQFYPHTKEDENDVACRGVDCSGLLYQATKGSTPRNTSDLLNIGVEVTTGKTFPLDLFVWRGHLVIALNSEIVIESHIKNGVVRSPLKERYPQILELTQKQNKILYRRRWHPDYLTPS